MLAGLGWTMGERASTSLWEIDIKIDTYNFVYGYSRYSTQCISNSAYHKWKKASGLEAEERVMEGDVRRYSIDCNLGRCPFAEEEGGRDEI